MNTQNKNNTIFFYKNLLEQKLAFMIESLIKSSSATSSNSEIGNSDSPKVMLPPRYRLICPLTFSVEELRLSSKYQKTSKKIKGRDKRAT